MQEGYVIYREDGGNKYVTGTESIKPTSLPEGHGYVHWVVKISGGFPKIWESADDKKRRFPPDAWGSLSFEDDPPFVDTRPFSEQRECGYVIELDTLSIKWRNISEEDGESGQKTIDAKAEYDSARSDIKSKYPKT